MSGIASCTGFTRLWTGPVADCHPWCVCSFQTSPSRSNRMRCQRTPVTPTAVALSGCSTPFRDGDLRGLVTHGIDVSVPHLIGMGLRANDTLGGLAYPLMHRRPHETCYPRRTCLRPSRITGDHTTADTQREGVSHYFGSAETPLLPKIHMLTHPVRRPISQCYPVYRCRRLLQGVR